ncbi:heat shock 70 kDa protein 12A-like [Saccostrea echinata]|uniref:heat shock 70 kDa protein 12A-like n=1 Tax=Saccostrea echinata TaxID=191078 RepID=UPI002A839490|nr:heat shock 70 kDa protein 12A-like [Saccostrea echinata]
MAEKGKTYMVVAAIDFGTTYSGYAFSFLSDYRRDPLSVYTNTRWENEGDGTFKTPTTILFDEQERFHSFGYDAEKKYASLASENEEDEEGEDDLEKENHQNWFYFRRFKMKLFKAISQGGRPRGKRITEDMQLTAQNGNKMSAIKVFSGAIRFLKDHLDKVLVKQLESKEKSGKSVKQTSWADDIRWVLTVPAIWSNEAKQFMRRAAEQAGIKGDQLILALEPEAAAIFCKQIALSKQNDESEISAYQPGKKFMVVDCGGGTVDVTAHKVVEDGSLKELHCATGDAIGGTNVDRMFFDALTQWLGADVVNQFKRENAADWLDLEKNFESKKRGIGRNEEENVTFSNLGELCQKYKSRSGNSVNSRFADLNMQKSVKVFKENKFRFESSYLRELAFDGPINAVINHLERLFLNHTLSDIDTILLVGGFSECPILQQKIKDSFPNKIVTIPPEPNLAVLKGAVIFGHSPKSISQRLSPRYYGIATNVPFERGKHPESNLMHIDGADICTDVFKCMIKKNAPLTRIQKTFTPSTEYSRYANIEIYESDSNVFFCNDSGCRMLGNIVVEISECLGKDRKREIDVSLEFGSTELYVVAQDRDTKNIQSAKFECLKK